MNAARPNITSDWAPPRQFGKDFLVSLGVPGDRLKTISYGKERPQCTESTESCWQKNRRAHFSPGSRRPESRPGRYGARQ